MREAVKVFDVSRPTLTKALKSGKVSGVQDGKGRWQVDPSELARVYQRRSPEAGKADKVLPGNLPTVNSLLQADAKAELAALQAELEQEKIRRAAAEALAEERAKHIEDLRRMLPPPGETPRKRWWPW